MQKIIDIKQIEYNKNPESRLLFAAVALLMADNYPDKTPEEVIDILDETAEDIFDEAEG